MTQELHQLSATEAARQIAAGQIASEDVVRACLARIDQTDGHLRAWSWVDPQRAIAAARDADTAQQVGAALGPLHGVPLAVKDILDTADLPTQHNSRIYRDLQQGKDAAVVAILRAAGAILLGKTETIEFGAHGRHAVTRNPFDAQRTPGGSSSGSAAAVADRSVAISLGTQTGGSVIRPAAYCSVFGFKPTHGVVSTEGAKHFSPTLDTIGWFARTLEDIALLAEVLHVSDEASPVVAETSALRIGVCRTPYWGEKAKPALHEALDEAIGRLREAGVTVVEAELDSRFDRLNLLKETIMRAEGHIAFLDLERSHPQQLSPGIVARMNDGRNISRRALGEARDQAAALRLAFDAFAAPFDAILTPSATGEPPLGRAHSGDAIFNGLWTLLHVPALNVPGLFSRQGLPVGLQLVAPRFDDRALLGVAARIAPLFQTPRTSSL
ncbi:amidase [Variovorax boronicumulans]|uniref:amidase n=1 Tax=Variovorax boronicumulans TaxID=436515 RepID=UPI001C592E7B